MLLVSIAAIQLSVHGQRTLAELEFEAENINRVRIKGRFCDVEIKKGSRVYCNGIIRGTGDPDDYEFKSDITGDELVIEVIKLDKSWNRIQDAYLELTLTDNVDVFVKNSSGDVEVFGLTSESFNIETTSGDIEIEQMSGRLLLESTSGDIELSGTQGEIKMKSTSGDQQVVESNGDISARCTSGDVKINRFSGMIQVQTTSGNIEASRGTGILSFKASSGDIDCYGLDLRGDTQFETTSGDIDIELLNQLNTLSFDLKSTSGDLRVGSRTSEDNLYMKQGGIWIIGRSSSGSQNYSN